MNRREKREAVFLLLYQSLINDDTLEEITELNIAEFELAAKSAEADWLIARAKAITDNADKVDEIISKYSKTRKVERIPKISVAIMRVALYEMDCDEEVPDKVAMNEAIELCKKYADEKDRQFVSGLLGGYYRDKHGE
jgi:N utilization substance protein B